MKTYVVLSITPALAGDDRYVQAVPAATQSLPSPTVFDSYDKACRRAEELASQGRKHVGVFEQIAGVRCVVTTYTLGPHS